MKTSRNTNERGPASGGGGPRRGQKSKRIFRTYMREKLAITVLVITLALFGLVWVLYRIIRDNNEQYNKIVLTQRQQEYDSYLQKLGEVLPELYSAAYQRYKDRGDSLEEEYRKLLELEQTEYGRYRDKVDDLKYQQGVEAELAAAEQERKDKNYDRLVELITKTGYAPTAEDLENSGMTQEQADAYLNKYGGDGASSSFGPSNTYLSYYYGYASNGGSKAQSKLDANMWWASP